MGLRITKATPRPALLFLSAALCLGLVAYEWASPVGRRAADPRFMELLQAWDRLRAARIRHPPIIDRVCRMQSRSSCCSWSSEFSASGGFTSSCHSFR